MADEKLPGASSDTGFKAPIAEPLAMAPIPLNPGAAKPVSATKPASSPHDQAAKDTFRELIETIVFVVVLVLLLKTFLAEAFVIPTGSMADTLLGYHFKATCAQCRYPNLINASWEADPQGRTKEFNMSYQCQNCGFNNIMRQAVPQEGKR